MKINLKQLTTLFSFLLIGLFVFNNGTARAQTPPRPTPPPPQPASKIVLLDVEKIVSPALLKPGEAMTYTVRVTNQGDLEASTIILELPLVGDQEFTGFSASGSGFSLDSSDEGKLVFSRQSMLPNTDVTFRVYATVPTNTTRNYLQQAITATWRDEKNYRTATFDIRAAIDIPPNTPPPTVPPVTPRPSDPELPTSGPFAPQSAPGTPNTETRWYFQTTKHYLSNGFLAYWLQNGSVLNFGYPLSEEFSENGMTVQYFQRAVFEYHPQNPPGYEILTRSLGRELDKVETPDPTSPGEGSIYFVETGHWLDSRLVETWQKRGELRAFGYPITPPKTVGNKLIQWFERSRLELDLSKANPLVEIAPVGKEYAVAKGYLKG
jgi:uncharacterized repeat protein (TIGR01451 family)